MITHTDSQQSLAPDHHRFVELGDRLMNNENEEHFGRKQEVLLHSNFLWFFVYQILTFVTIEEHCNSKSIMSSS